MTTLIHIVGPQGSGKSLLAGWIVAAVPGAVHLDAEQVRGMGNAEIRRLHPAALVVVEAQGRECRHDDRAVGDMVLVLEAGPTHAA